MNPTHRHRHEDENAEIAARRKGARRTALVIAVIALVVYGGFILTGVLGR